MKSFFMVIAMMFCALMVAPRVQAGGCDYCDLAKKAENTRRIEAGIYGGVQVLNTVGGVLINNKQVDGHVAINDRNAKAAETISLDTNRTNKEINDRIMDSVDWQTTAQVQIADKEAQTRQRQTAADLEASNNRTAADIYRTAADTGANGNVTIMNGNIAVAVSRPRPVQTTMQVSCPPGGGPCIR